MSKTPGKVIITPRPPVGSGGQNENELCSDVLKSALPDILEKGPIISHEEALDVENKLPPVAAKKADAIKKEALNAPQKKRVCKKKTKK